MLSLLLQPAFINADQTLELIVLATSIKVIDFHTFVGFYSFLFPPTNLIFFFLGGTAVRNSSMHACMHVT